MYSSRAASSPVAATACGRSAKSAHHLFGRLQIVLGVARQRPPGPRHGGLVANAREHVVERTIVGCGEPHAVGGHDRHAKRRGQREQRLVVALPRPAAGDAAARRTRATARKGRRADRAGRQRRTGGPTSVARPASAMSPSMHARRASSSCSAPSPFGAASFMRVISRHRLRYPSREATSTGSRQRNGGWGDCGFPLALMVSSAPTMALSPAFVAARWNRGMPDTPSRSSSASDEYPRAAARSTSVSGVEAPSRNEKAEAA